MYCSCSSHTNHVEVRNVILFKAHNVLIHMGEIAPKKMFLITTQYILLCHKEAQNIFIMLRGSSDHHYCVTMSPRNILIMSQASSGHPYCVTMKLRNPYYITRKLRHHYYVTRKLRTFYYVTMMLRTSLLCHKEAQIIFFMSQGTSGHPYYGTRKLKISLLCHNEAQNILIMSQGSLEQP